MTWKNGETISPLGLNRLEEAVAEMSQEYTPTVWAVGDKITAEKMNKLEQGVASISEGSGGSSDFSTANVTLEVSGIESSEIYYFYNNPVVNNSVVDSIFSGVFVSELNGVKLEMDEGVGVSNGTPVTISVDIVNGMNIIVNTQHDDETFTVTGNATAKTVDWNGDTVNVVAITGDCTISVAGHK